MTLLRILRHALLATAIAVAAVLTAAQAQTAAGSRASFSGPYHCTAPTHAGDGRRIALTLDWPGGPVPPGTPQALGIHLTNVASARTPDPTLVVVHGFVPNTYTADPDVTLTYFATGVSFTIPAGIAPGETVSHTVTVRLGASIPPHTTEHCDVTAFSGTDQATAPYDTVTGNPVVHLDAVVLSAAGKPGATTGLQAVLGNAGPSNEYTGHAVFTFTAPDHTRWASPSAYRCTRDISGRTLTCTYPGSPLTWRNEIEQLPLTISSSAAPGTTLHGGRITATDTFDPKTFRGRFSVDTTG